MFSDFFQTLKEKGIAVSLSEWLTLQEALDKGLCKSSLTNFYYIARMILVKSETEYDKFDMAFDEFFKGIHSDNQVTSQMLEWLDKEDLNEQLHESDKEWLNKVEEIEVNQEEIMAKFQERLKDQDSEHNGGNQWIGTMGKSSYGNTGGNIGGIRIGGKTGYQSAFEVIGERKYKDFRDDRVLDHRQFQRALKKLRQYSTKLEVPETELNLTETINKTCNNGGYLRIIMEKPRKNTVKLLLLMDSGGTMIPYSSLVNDLFQSVKKSNHFKEVACYYFHNCIYSKVYKTPECENGDWVDTEWMFRNLDKDYKVMIVGDAAMAPEELYSPSGNYRGPNDGNSGMEWLEAIKRNYRKVVWLNPKMAIGAAPWREAEAAIQEVFPMHKLTVEGLEKSMDVLLK